MINPNFKNLAENLIIVVIVGLLGGTIGYTASTRANKQVVQQLIPTIEKAIDKETIKNEIKNEIDIKVDKIKKSDSINVNINQTPDNNQKPTNTFSKSEACIIGLKDYNKLTNSQKKRLDKWLRD